MKVLRFENRHLAPNNLESTDTRCIHRRSSPRGGNVTGIVRWIGVLLTILAMLPMAMADNSMPVDPGKIGENTADGTIVVTIKWKQGSEMKAVPTEIQVPKGKTPKEVADLVVHQLKQNDQLNGLFNFSDPESETDKGTYEVTATATKSNIQVEKITADTKEGAAATGLSYGGALAYLDTPIDGEFSVAGNVGRAGDSFAIQLFDSTGKQTFELASYDGLTPTQIEAALAADINRNSGYSASISNGVVYIAGAENFFRVDFALGGGTQDFSLSAGAFVVPEPGTFALLASGGLGLSGFLRRRLRTRS